MNRVGEDNRVRHLGFGGLGAWLTSHYRNDAQPTRDVGQLYVASYPQMSQVDKVFCKLLIKTT